jgi:uncharacterized DUF497 family protein
MKIRIEPNRAKHGIDFSFAMTAFDDPLALTTRDRDVDGEQRYQLLGAVFARIILVAYAVRVNSQTGSTDDEPVTRNHLREKGHSGGKETL